MFSPLCLALAASALAVSGGAPDGPDSVATARAATVIQDPAFRRAMQVLRDDHQRLVDEIIALTQIPSPPFGEEARGHAFARLMQTSGFADVAIDGIGNVIATRPGRDHGLPPMIIAAHLDTVFPAGTDVHVRREGTRLMAPGVGDDTRGLAVLLAIARAMNSAAIQTERDILFVGDVGEEGQGDLRGMRYLFSRNERARTAKGFISVDSSGASGIVIHGVGSHRYHIVFSGPGAHSYMKFGAVNPLVALSKTVTGLYTIPVPTEPKTTYSASVVGGGTSVNTIPAKVFLDVDIRSTSPAEIERVDAKLHQIAAQAVEEENRLRSTENGRVAVDFQSIGNRPAGNTSETDSLAAGAFASSRAFGYAPKFIAVSTDANIPMSMNIPAIAIGSGGSGGGEHTPAEAIDVEINESVRGMGVAMATLIGAAGK
jgi:tripeptide aminopeptidase